MATPIYEAVVRERGFNPLRRVERTPIGLFIDDYPWAGFRVR